METLASRRWVLAAWGPGDDEVTAEVTLVREVGADEVAALREASGFIQRLTDGNPFNDLRRRHDQWVSAFERGRLALASGTSRDQYASLREEIPDAVAAVLVTGRTFVDQTDRWLKHVFGQASSERLAVEAESKRQHATQLGYAIAYYLRNTLHRMPVVRVRGTSREQPDGTVAMDLEVTMDEDVIDSRWPRAVRDAVQALEKPIHMAPVLSGLVLSCEHILARTLQVAEPRARDAIARIEAAAAEVRTHSSEAIPALVEEARASALQDLGRRTLAVSPLDTGQVSAYKSALSQSESLLNT